MQNIEKKYRKYKAIMLSSASKKKMLKKEWSNAEAARKNGEKKQLAGVGCAGNLRIAS